MINKISSCIKDPHRIFGALARRGFFNWMGDEQYLRWMYRSVFGKEPDLENPRTFNEKIQWLKLHDRRPEYTAMVDKYEVKKYVADKIGEQYIIPTYGVWDHFDEIDFDTLPDQFVLKCTHDSGGVVICRDKAAFDQKAARRKISKSLKKNYYYWGREWPYKNVKPRIIAEQYMESGDKAVPEDYKVYCFHGKPKYIVVFHNRFDSSKELSETVYDTDWIPQGISLDDHFKVSNDIEPKPACLPVMLAFAERLSEGMAQSRIDFYIVDDLLKFGEITLYTASGMQPMIPETLDEVLGREIRIDAGGGYKLSGGKFLVWSVCNDYEGIEDYKIFNCHGKPKLIDVHYDRAVAHKRNLYTVDWKYIDAEIGYPASREHCFKKPQVLDEMLYLAEELSRGIPYVRTDFYIWEGRVYFGELTFYSDSGLARIEPEEFAIEMGNWIELPLPWKQK